MSKRLDKFLEVFLLMKMYDLLREEILVVVGRERRRLDTNNEYKINVGRCLLFPQQMVR